MAHYTIKQIKNDDTLKLTAEIYNVLFLESIIGYHKAYLLGEMVSIVGGESSHFRDYLFQEYPEYYYKSKWLNRKIMKDFPELKEGKQFIHEFQASWWLKLLEQKTKRKKLFISLSNGSMAEQILLKKIRWQFNEHYMIDEVNKIEDSDIIITDSNLLGTTEEKVIHVVNNQLTEKDYRAIKLVLHS